jgi:hypothetical protein
MIPDESDETWTTKVFLVSATFSQSDLPCNNVYVATLHGNKNNTARPIASQPLSRLHYYITSPIVAFSSTSVCYINPIHNAIVTMAATTFRRRRACLSLAEHTTRWFNTSFYLSYYIYFSYHWLWILLSIINGHTYNNLYRTVLYVLRRVRIVWQTWNTAHAFESCVCFLQTSHTAHSRSVPRNLVGGPNFLFYLLFIYNYSLTQYQQTSVNIL